MSSRTQRTAGNSFYDECEAAPGSWTIFDNVEIFPDAVVGARQRNTIVSSWSSACRRMNTTSTVATDLDVIRRILDGKVNDFELLFNKYQSHVLKIVKKHVPYEQVEDVAHDVFIRIYQSLATFKNTSDFRHWVSSIAVRTCYDFWRKQYRNREVPISSLSEKQQTWLESVLSAQSGQSFRIISEAQEAKELLDWALNQLSAEDRMVIELVYLEGYTGREAAKLLGWSTSNVKVRSFRARKKLEKLLVGRTT